MQPDREREADRWFAQAERDLEDARYCAAGARHSLACFVAQQAAEKAFKAFLLAHSTEEPWGHSVAELGGDAAALDADLFPLAQLAAPLDKFYIPTRYPNGLPGGIPADAFSAEDALSAVRLSAEVIETIGRKLHPSRT